MAKAVLIMDMPEQVCQKCTLCYEKMCIRDRMTGALAGCWLSLEKQQ